MAKKILKKAQYGRGVEKYQKPADTRSTNEKIGIPPPPGSTPSFDENRRLGSSKYTKEVYRKDGYPKLPKNKPAGSPIRRFKKGGSIKKK